MNFLKNLFGGGGIGGSSGDRGLYFYVQPKRCEEIVEIRIDPMNELSTRDEGDGYISRKMVSAIRCPFQAELIVTFDKNRKIVDTKAENGQVVDKDAFVSWQESRGA